METIGGHFAIPSEFTHKSLNVGKLQFPEKQLLRSGTDSLRLILQDIQKKSVNPVTTILVPSFTCPKVYELIISCKAKIVSYKIGPDLLIDKKDLYSKLDKNIDAVLVTDFFGLIESSKNQTVLEILRHGSACILDAVGVADELSKDNIVDKKFYAFNSLRKFSFFPDGSQLVGDVDLSKISRDLEVNNVDKVLEYKYELFSKRQTSNEISVVEKLRGLEQGIQSNSRTLVASKYSHILFQRWNFQDAAAKRKENFNQLLSGLRTIQDLSRQIEIPFSDEFTVSAPLVFPIRVLQDRDDLKKFLFERNIVSVIHWLGPKDDEIDFFSEELSSTLLSLPIDHRISRDNIDYMVETFRQYVSLNV